MSLEVKLGATYLGEGRCRFLVWAPLAQTVEVHVVAPQERSIRLKKGKRGYYHALVEDVEPGSLYIYRLDGQKECPDPASRFQPHGVHGPSQIIDSHFVWEDKHWFGLALRNYLIYELHVGTFTSEGTFEAIIPYLDELKNLGITALELMPITQFPGERNWGYDGVYPFAVQHSYGGPEGLKRLVNACHQRGLAIILDAVYNHLGAEGNYLRDFGPYFTDRYKNVWGPAFNFDGPHSDAVRRFFIENALYWVTEFHIDALRLDAVDTIVDLSAQPFLEELAMVVHEQAERLNRQVFLMAESALNTTRLVRAPELGGYGLDAQWNDEFHHILHVLLTGEQTIYYQDYGRISHLVKAFREGFVYSGEYSPYRQHRYGISSQPIPAFRFVVFTQSHDQVGNRLFSERLGQLVSFEGLKLAAGVVLLSPFIPLLFMGEEYGETAPFPYFISHSDPELIEAVRQGRREEFAIFEGDPPDPQDEATFQQAKLNHKLRYAGHHRTLFQFYQELIRLRKTLPALVRMSKETLEVIGYEKEKVLFIRRWSGEDEACILFHFSEVQISVTVPVPEGHWHKQLDSADKQWQGSGSAVPEQLYSTGEVTLLLPPHMFVLFTRMEEM